MQIKIFLAKEFQFYNQPPNRDQIEMWESEYRSYDPTEVAKSYIELRSVHEKMPMPSAVKDRLLKYPSADEAWTVMGMTEDDHACMNQASSIAWEQVRVMAASGDLIAAKISFKAIYESEVKKLKMENIKCKHFISRGLRREGIETFTEKCISMKYIDAKLANEFNPERALPHNQLQIAGPKETFTDEVREENIKKWKEMMSGLAKKKIPTEDES